MLVYALARIRGNTVKHHEILLLIGRGHERGECCVSYVGGGALKVPCSYEVSAMGKFTLLRYLSEF